MKNLKNSFLAILALFLLSAPSFAADAYLCIALIANNGNNATWKASIDLSEFGAGAVPVSWRYKASSPVNIGGSVSTGWTSFTAGYYDQGGGIFAADHYSYVSFVANTGVNATNVTLTVHCRYWPGVPYASGVIFDQETAFVTSQPLTGSIPNMQPTIPSMNVITVDY